MINTGGDARATHRKVIERPANRSTSDLAQQCGNCVDKGVSEGRVLGFKR